MPSFYQLNCPIFRSWPWLTKRDNHLTKKSILATSFYPNYYFFGKNVRKPAMYLNLLCLFQTIQANLCNRTEGLNHILYRTPPLPAQAEDTG